MVLRRHVVKSPDQAGYTSGISVVAKILIEPTPHPYGSHRAYCLFFSDGSCGKCIDRRLINAISKTGHDKEKCRQHLDPLHGVYQRDLQIRRLCLRIAPPPPPLA